MRGQLIFDELMNISEEKEKKDSSRVDRVDMVDPCYYCLCNSCVNNAESITVTLDEVGDNYEPCYLCDDCKFYDDKNNNSMEIGVCNKYLIDNYHALNSRKKFKSV